MGIRIGRFVHRGTTHWGVVREGAVSPLSQTYPTLRDLLSQSDLAAQLQAAVAAGPGLPLDDVRWLSPITRPVQIICQGVNYASHRQEGGYAPEKPAFNVFFTKAYSTICGPLDDVVRPPHVRLLDYEVELGIVIGAPMTEPVTITRDNLHDYVAGIVITDDISARDVQIPEGQWIKGKSYRTFCPCGPYLYLLDASEMDAIDQLELRLWVNGELRQSADTGQLLYKPAETLTELSGLMDLFPGDLLLTGTPAGVALKMPPSRADQPTGLFSSGPQGRELFVQQQLEIADYLQPGDVIRATIHSPSGHIDLGMQENRIVAATV